MAIDDHYADQHRPISAEEALQYIGQQLHNARRERGEDIDDVADQLRIKPAYLTAIESGDLGAIPGRPYALGFVRSYADYLGFEGDQVVAGVKAAESRALADPALRTRTPIVESTRPGLVAMGSALILLIGAYGVWYAVIRGDRPTAERVAELPADASVVAVDLFRIQPQQDQPESAAAIANDTTDADQGDPQADAELAEQPQPPIEPPIEPLSTVEPEIIAGRDPENGDQLALLEIADPDAPTDLPTLEPVSEIETSRGEPSASELLASLRSDEVQDETRVFGAIEDNPRVIMIAEQPSWIQVRSQSRDYVRTRTLDIGDRFVLPNRDDLALWTGNAGGLLIIVDGQAIGRLGKSGEVIRDVSLAPDDLLPGLQLLDRTSGT